jgi:hypothetical protein
MFVVGYTYRADLICPACVVDTYRARRRADGAQLDSIDATTRPAESFLDDYAAWRGIDRYCESSFDSDDFPKVVFRDQVEDGDTCGECGEFLDD